MGAQKNFHAQELKLEMPMVFVLTAQMDAQHALFLATKDSNAPPVLAQSAKQE
jgi:hypothetical protein